ncbi:MAG: aminoacyl-tRNA hydrolase [Candidatus Kapaibacteriota bacterium]
MEHYDWLFIGLGNPKPEYFKNRHNIGWSVITKFMQKYNLDFFDKTRSYKIANIRLANNNILLALPLTYMNLSGEAALKLISKYKIPIEKLVILVDEYNFPLGKIHLKQGGSDGGHNGVASIIEKLNNPNFIRLRLGIGKNFGPGELVDYVLSDFNNEEFEAVEVMQSKAIDAINHLVTKGYSRAASDINSGKLWLPNSSTSNDKLITKNIIKENNSN